MRWHLLWLLLGVGSLFSQETLLAPKDVQPTMQRFLDLHLEHKEITIQLLERSLKIYLDQFDSAHIYLTAREVAPYLQVSDRLRYTLYAEYQKSDLTTYEAMNELIQEAILRAREWRATWMKNPQELIAATRTLMPVKFTPNKPYAKSIAELKERHYDQYVRLLALHIEQVAPADYEGKEAKLMALCEKYMRRVEQEYLSKDDHNYQLAADRQEHQTVLRVLKALANSLDSHTAYYSAEEAYAMKVQLEKGMCGIGVVLREGLEGIVIQELVKGGPAEKCGKIHPGDRLVEVDEAQIQGLSFQKVLDLMRGVEGSKTRLGVLHRTDREPQLIHVELVRDKITLDNQRVTYSAEPYGEGWIGKITLHSFYEGENGISSESDIKEAIDQLRQQGPLYGLVLDMRDNGGGFLSQAVKVSSLFMANGVVVISKYSDGSIKYYRALAGTHYYEGPLVIITSRGSASATEIVAQTLQDYGLAIIVGDDQTYGKGTIQHQTITHDQSNAYFKVTVGRYYTVSGKSTQIEGVKADVTVPTDLQFESIGEAYSDYPLAADRVDPAFEDSLSDLDPFVRKWFQKYYLPYLQPVESRWTTWIPQLKINSKKRIEHNRNFQLFLQQVQAPSKEKARFGVNDLQMEESVNLIKDLYLLNQASLSADPAAAAGS